MYRHRLHLQLRYGHFAQYLTIAEELNELARARGWAEATFWAPTIGKNNLFVAETEYPDLATFQRETEEFYSDAEVMKLIRSTAEHVIEGSAYDELLESAPHLA
jgi:hypothetical protein